MRALLDQMPRPTVWEEGSSLSLPNALALSSAPLRSSVVPVSMFEWKLIRGFRNSNIELTIVSLSEDLNSSPMTIQVTQTFNKQVKLPISAYPNWGIVNSLYELRAEVRRAHELSRMLIVVCSKQNSSFWLPKGFHQWAAKYPRLMFAAIDRDVANNDSSSLCQELLGFPAIDGVCFVSHVNGQPCRAFIGNNIQTQDIFNSLLTRYQVSCSSGEVPTVERDGMISSVRINTNNALEFCKGKLKVVPYDFSLSFRFENIAEQVSSFVEN